MQNLLPYTWTWHAEWNDLPVFPSPKICPVVKMKEAHRGLRLQRAQVRDQHIYLTWTVFYIYVCETWSSSSGEVTPPRTCVCLYAFVRRICLYADDAPASCYAPPPTSGHNTQPQFCLWDINIPSPLSSFFISGSSDSTVRYIKAGRTIKAAAELVCFAFHSLRHCFHPSQFYVNLKNIYMKERCISHGIEATESRSNNKKKCRWWILAFNPNCGCRLFVWLLVSVLSWSFWSQ